jgi:cytochrome c-type biogenesis protein CcmH/NrfF
MAPCCWHENLSVHQSPAADELRAEIRKMAEAGVTDEQIKARVVAQHTSRILAMPEGAKGQWLSWTPWVFTAVALTAVGWWLRRAAVRPKAVPAAAGPVAVVNEEDLEW